MNSELIALGLRNEGLITPNASLRTAIERLLGLLRDVITSIDLADDRSLHDHIDACLRSVAGARDTASVAAAIELCNEACRQILTKIDKDRVKQKEEIASLVGMVREALAIVAGDEQNFSKQIDSSMTRFESLVQVDDVRQLKTLLIHEVTTVRAIAAERQKSWEKTCEQFTARVETLEQQLSATRQEAALDPLTQIANRGTFDRACKDWIATRHGQFVLGIIDIDHFKSINDTHGHGVGDRAIVAVAHALKSSVREGVDVVGRVGGDEFAVLIAELNLRQAESRLRMVASSLSSLEIKEGAPPIKVTLSCGVAEHSAGDTVKSLMERADAALYEAKRLGRNRVVSKTKPTLRELRGY